MRHGVQQRHVAAWLERQVMQGMARQGLPPRVHDDQLGATVLHRVLDEGRCDRVIHRRVGADHDDDLGIQRG